MDLWVHGVTVVPAFDGNDQTRRAWEASVWSAMDEFPEYRAKGTHVQRVLGGFGALGNPASFHHPVVQRLRTFLKSRVSTPLFREYVRVCAEKQKHKSHPRRAPAGMDQASWNGFLETLSMMGPDKTRRPYPENSYWRQFESRTIPDRLEMLYDRLCLRDKAFGAVSAESWHRDIYDGPKFGLRPLPPDDDIFGGWVNLSGADQRFVGIVGSHTGADARDAQEKGGGFAVLTPEQVQSQRVNERLAGQANKTFGTTVRTNANGHIVVPPGYMIVFFQRLLHSVVSGTPPAASVPQMRLFVGHRLTRDEMPLFPLEEVIVNNAVPRIPSGQIPPMYSQNHYMFFAKYPKYQQWAANTFHRSCLFERLTPDGTVYYTPGSAGNRNPRANRERTMTSLAAMGFKLYEYSAAARRTLTPESIA